MRTQPSTALATRAAARLITASFLAGALAAGATVGASGASAATTGLLPFVAHLSGSAQLTSPTTGTFTGSGTATGMGVIANSGSVVAYMNQPSNTCPNGFHSVNSETFIDAGGNTLSIQSSDVTCPVGPKTPTEFRGTGHWVVTGGTGRFVLATGHGTYSGYANFGHNFRFTFNGTVS